MSSRNARAAVCVSADLELSWAFRHHPATVTQDRGRRERENIPYFRSNPARSVKRYDLAKAAVERLVKDGVDAELVTAFTVAKSEMLWYYSAADAMLLCSVRGVSDLG